jgi:Methylamine utilisation protein MauE
MSVVVDPAIVLLARASVSLLFAVAAVHKLLRPHQFVSALEAYELAGRRFNAVIARILPLLELAAAIGIWIVPSRPSASALAATLFVIYAAAIGINLTRGRRDLDCGCTAFGRRSPIAGWMLVRNSILAVVAVLASAPTMSRALTLTDALTVAGGLCVLTFIYLAADALLATATSVRRVEFQS